MNWTSTGSLSKVVQREDQKTTRKRMAEMLKAYPEAAELVRENEKLTAEKEEAIRQKQEILEDNIATGKELERLEGELEASGKQLEAEKAAVKRLKDEKAAFSQTAVMKENRQLKLDLEKRNQQITQMYEAGNASEARWKKHDKDFRRQYNELREAYSKEVEDGRNSQKLVEFQKLQQTIETLQHQIAKKDQEIDRLNDRYRHGGHPPIAPEIVEAMRQYHRTHPNATWYEIHKAFKVSQPTVKKYVKGVK